uniref:Uncharacterized protein n=1 Tax=Rhabditophanes sp. KR3021 TaxID=114890 RepID=A0AC35THR0_9BILA
MYVKNNLILSSNFNGLKDLILKRPPSQSVKPPNLNCSQIFANNQTYIKEAAKNRFSLKQFDDDYLSLSCDDIRKRGLYPSQPSSPEEGAYPIAFARNVFEDYISQELFFRMTYQPQNHYCFAVDSKATDLQVKLIQLSLCFPNVYVTRKRFDMNSNGLHGSSSHFECMKRLATKDFKYLFLLQTQELPTKTNWEFVQILTAMNSVLTMRFVPEKYFITRSVKLDQDWTYKNLNFFYEGDPRRTDTTIQNMTVQHQAGLYQAGMAKETVEYLVNNVNLTTFLNQMNVKDKFGVDEVFWQTLMSDNILAIPGYVPRECLLKYYPPNEYINRHTLWGGPGPGGDVHHSIATRSIEDMHLVLKLHEFFAYRYRASFDLGAIFCHAEYIIAKQQNKIRSSVDLKFYSNLKQSVFGRRQKRNALDEVEKQIIKDKIEDKIAENVVNHVQDKFMKGVGEGIGKALDNVFKDHVVLADNKTKEEAIEDSTSLTAADIDSVVADIEKKIETNQIETDDITVDMVKAEVHNITGKDLDIVTEKEQESIANAAVDPVERCEKMAEDSETVEHLVKKQALIAQEIAKDTEDLKALKVEEEVILKQLTNDTETISSTPQQETGKAEAVAQDNEILKEIVKQEVILNEEITKDAVMLGEIAKEEVANAETLVKNSELVEDAVKEELDIVEGEKNSLQHIISDHDEPATEAAAKPSEEEGEIAPIHTSECELPTGKELDAVIKDIEEKVKDKELKTGDIDSKLINEEFKVLTGKELLPDVLESDTKNEIEKIVDKVIEAVEEPKTQTKKQITSNPKKSHTINFKVISPKGTGPSKEDIEDVTNIIDAEIRRGEIQKDDIDEAYIRAQITRLTGQTLSPDAKVEFSNNEGVRQLNIDINYNDPNSERPSPASFNKVIQVINDRFNSGQITAKDVDAALLNKEFKKVCGKTYEFDVVVKSSGPPQNKLGVSSRRIQQDRKIVKPSPSQLIHGPRISQPKNVNEPEDTFIDIVNDVSRGGNSRFEDEEQPTRMISGRNRINQFIPSRNEFIPQQSQNTFRQSQSGFIPGSVRITNRLPPSVIMGGQFSPNQQQSGRIMPNNAFVVWVAVWGSCRSVRFEEGMIVADEDEPSTTSVKDKDAEENEAPEEEGNNEGGGEVADEEEEGETSSPTKKEPKKEGATTEAAEGEDPEEEEESEAPTKETTTKKTPSKMSTETTASKNEDSSDGVDYTQDDYDTTTSRSTETSTEAVSKTTSSLVSSSLPTLPNKKVVPSKNKPPPPGKGKGKGPPGKGKKAPLKGKKGPPSKGKKGAPAKKGPAKKGPAKKAPPKKAAPKKRPP